MRIKKTPLFGIVFTSFILVIVACSSSGIKINTSENLQPGKSSVLNAWIQIPTGEGPFPAVILMHGCGGWHGGENRAWANWFNDRGWAALAIDSFATRGVKSLCKAGGYPRYKQRALDAFGGMDYLETLPNIDADRVVVMGFSHGGTAAGQAMDAQVADVFREADKTRFIGGILMYPGSCAIYEPYGPILIIYGDKDNWTPPLACQTALDWYNQEKELVHLHLIPGATHSFDMFSWKGRAVGPRMFRHYHMVPDREATNMARQIVDEFLLELDR